MAKSITRPAESWTYILKADRELAPAEQSQFTLRPLTQVERATVRDEIARIQTARDGTKSVISSSQRQGIEIAAGCIVGVENFPSDGPKAWPSERDPQRKYLELLSDDSVQELANEIWEKSTIGDVVKNS